jgi:hypothetical protein
MIVERVTNANACFIKLRDDRFRVVNRRDDKGRMARRQERDLSIYSQIVPCFSEIVTVSANGSAIVTVTVTFTPVSDLTDVKTATAAATVAAASLERH